MSERAVMRVLGTRGLAEGRYCEDVSGLEWLTLEAADVVAAVGEGRDIGALLIDTGYWREDEGPFPDEFRQELIEAAAER